MTVLLNEFRLVAEARKRPAAFAKIYEHYFPRIYTYIRYRVSDDAVADDLTAFTFERALTRLNRYDANRGPFAAWLFGIARHAVMNHNRKAKRWQAIPFEWLHNHFRIGPHQSPDCSNDGTERVQRGCNRAPGIETLTRCAGGGFQCRITEM